MAKYHVNPNTGRPSACGAVTKCPFGGAEDHYESRDAAQAAYEKQQQKQEVPQPAKKKISVPTEGYRQRDLRVAVKTTTDQQMLSYAARDGDEGVLRDLAANPHVSHKDLQTAYPRVQNEKTKQLFEAHPNFVKKSYTAKEIEEIVNNPKRHGELAKFIEGNATDRMVRKISDGVDSYSPLHKVILTSGNKQISKETKIASLKAVGHQSWDGMSQEIASSKNFHVQEYLPHMSYAQKEWVANNAQKPATMEQLAELTKEDLAAGEHNEAANDLAISIYKNNFTADRTKRDLVEASPDVASYHKLSETRAFRFPEFADMTYDSVDSSRPLAAGDKETFVFDPAVVKNLNFQGNDLKVYMRHMRGKELYNESYNEDTGVFTGERMFGDPDA